MNENKTNINWYPGHMEKTKKLIIKEYANIDIVYELIDARIPRSSKITNIYEMIGNKPKIIIMTKKDLADPLILEKWVKYYENLGSVVIPADLADDNDIRKIIKATHDLMEKTQAKRIDKGLKAKEVHVLVVGIPNVGKSTLINRLAGRKVANVGNSPGVTKHLSWLKTNHNIILLDTPGILWPKLDNHEIACNLAAFSSIKLEVLDVNEIACHILNKLNKYYPEKLKERYSLEQNNVELDIEAAYETIGRQIGAIRHNEVDYERVSNRLINDLKDEYIKGIVFDHEI